VLTAEVLGGKNSREKNGLLGGRAAILSVILSMIRDSYKVDSE
jgi:hypothetical protein